MAEVVPYPDDTSGILWKEADTGLRYYFKNILAKYACAKASLLGVDIIHNFTLAGSFDNPSPSLHTIYGPPTGRVAKILRGISQVPDNYFSGVSDSQRTLFSEAVPEIKFVDIVHKSIDTDNIKWDNEKEDYLLFIGKQQQDQALDLARRVASAANQRLIAVIQGKTEQIFNDDIKPWIDKDTRDLNLQFAQELPPEARYDLYRKAKGTFYVSQWEEPFGLEMLESLACGTPVIALRKGAASEVINHGETGFLVDTEKEMIEAVDNISEIDPARCRKEAQEKFSSEKIAGKYLEIYRKILSPDQ
jgi:glycosyltransferase involved in cell wall biosynthesis